MKRVFNALAAACLFAVGGASANVISTDVNIAPSNPFQYVHFNVTNAGLFNISADGSDTLGGAFNPDPQIYLFEGSVDLGNDIYDNDDIIGGNTTDSLIADADLAIGHYILAVSQAYYFASEAISGMHVDPVDQGLVRVTIESFNGTAVPEPATLALMAMGVLGLVSTRRKMV